MGDGPYPCPGEQVEVTIAGPAPEKLAVDYSFLVPTRFSTHVGITGKLQSRRACELRRSGAIFTVKALERG